MEQKATRLAAYCADLLGDGLRAVGFHSHDEFDVVHIREDLVEQYPGDRVQQFIQSSRDIHGDLQLMDEQMGSPEASLHILEEGLLAQFHYPAGDVVFLSMEREVGRNFTEFIDDCIDEMS